MPEFVHLHVHSEYSLLEGACSLTGLAATAREMGMGALALTDHGNLYGSVEFYKLARGAGVKPILGCEMAILTREEPDKEQQLHHLVLLAANNQGYRNLLELVTRANLAGYQDKPRLTHKDLEGRTEGLIALSGCSKGEIQSLLLAGDYEGAKSCTGSYRELFGPGGFYLELQDHGLKEERLINEGLLKLAGDLEVPITLTNNVHYLKSAQARLHDLLVSINTIQTIDSYNPLKLANDQYYFKSGQEMAGLLNYISPKIRAIALENTSIIAGKCNVDLGLGITRLPDVEVPEGYTPESYLRLLCEQGVKSNYESAAYDIRDRMEHELTIICGMGFAPYFLIVRDIVEFARSREIPVGPGRGSAGGSLVAYLLGIISIDPIKHKLYFERFLNPERPDLPDIDLDICQRRRDEILTYLFRKYGEERVAHIGVFSTFGARGAVREAGKALNIADNIVDPIARAMPHYSGKGGLASAISSLPEFKKISIDQEPARALIKGAQAIEGMVRHTSTHACGILISRDKLTEVVALERSNKGEIITQFPKEAIEDLGLLKIDLLGLRNLTIIDDTLKIIRCRKLAEGEKTPPRTVEEIPLNDEATYRLFQQGETIGCFQIESPGMRVLMKKLFPCYLEDIIALLSLYRPGPWDSGMVETYIRRRHGKEPVQYPHRDLEPVLKDTYGTILYQEQVMMIAHILAGYSLGEADILRRSITRRSPERMALQRERFVSGATAKGYSRKLAEEVFELLAKFAGYGFNKAHSTAYAYTSYHTAYLKVHYPVEYTAALLTSQMGFYGMAVYVEEARRRGVQFMLPDVNKSNAHFTVEGLEGDRAIRVGFASIKGLGPAAVTELLRARKAGTFNDFYDFCCRVNLEVVNQTVIQSLIKSGAMDTFGLTRTQALASLSYFLKLARSRQKTRHQGQVTFFDWGVVAEEEVIDYSRVPYLPDYTREEKLAAEKELLGIYISGHPLDKYDQVLSAQNVITTPQLGLYKEGDRVTVAGIMATCRRRPTKKGEYMLFILLEDREGQVEISLFPRIYQENIHKIDPDGLLVEGRLTFDGEEPKILVDKLDALKNLKIRPHKLMTLPGKI